MQKNIQKGCEYISDVQLSNGAFQSFSSPERFSLAGAREYNAIFASALGLCALAHLPDAHQICTKLADFLLSQKSNHWSFNYWARNSREASELPYPDDLDCTACVLVALGQFDKNLLNADVAAAFTQVLTFCEAQEGGPYYTWIASDTNDKAWRDVDLAVNANIGFALDFWGVELPSINELIEQAVAQNNFSSPYYADCFPIIYFISRFYRGSARQSIVDFLMKSDFNNVFWADANSVAFALSAAINLGVKNDWVDDAVHRLLQNQKSNGSWDAGAFCIDPAVDKKTFYAISPALTTALCLEALQKYTQTRIGDNTEKQKNAKLPDLFGVEKEQVIREFQADLAVFAPETRADFALMIAKVLEIDAKKPIITLPYLFHSALDDETRAKINDGVLRDAGLANLYGWIAYTIYDDFLDNEGNAKLLSLANFCMRRAALIFSKIAPDESGFGDLVEDIMNKIDAANGWEVSLARCKVDNGKCDVSRAMNLDWGDLNVLSDKSLGHALSSVAILANAGFSMQSDDVRALLDFFKNYIIARQLNDDMHDYESDLKQGIISWPLTILLKSYKKEVINLANDMQELQMMFWQETVVVVCDEITRRVLSAKEALEKISSLKNKQILFSLISSFEKGVELTLNERAETLGFLRAYTTQNDMVTIDKRCRKYLRKVVP